MIEPAWATLNLYQRTSSRLFSVSVTEVHAPVTGHVIWVASLRVFVVTSNAPMSQGAFGWRGTPRSSVVSQAVPPVLIAGLPGSSEWVGTSPPLLASGPSRGSVLSRSPPPPPQVASVLMLLPSDVTPIQFAPLAEATIELRSFTEPPRTR